MRNVSELNFGRIALTDRLNSLLNIMNGHVWSVCAALPRPIRDSAVLFLQKQYAGFHPDDARSFLLRYFHPPAWTILEHLNRRRRLSDETLSIILKAQASAMVVHMLDDHIVDGQVRPSHLLLHLRTAYWSYFTENLNSFQTQLSIKQNVYGECVDAYLAGVHGSSTPLDGDQYRGEFLKQAATWLIAPLLLAEDEQRAAVKSIYEDFALAWRLLDDVRDAATDAATGDGTAVYFALDDDGRAEWKRVADESISGATVSGDKVNEEQESPRIMRILHEKGVLDALIGEIHDRLARAASGVRRLGLDELAEEYEALARLRNGDEPAAG